MRFTISLKNFEVYIEKLKFGRDSPCRRTPKKNFRASSWRRQKSLLIDTSFISLPLFVSELIVFFFFFDRLYIGTFILFLWTAHVPLVTRKLSATAKIKKHVSIKQSSRCLFELEYWLPPFLLVCKFCQLARAFCIVCSYELLVELIYIFKEKNSCVYILLCTVMLYINFLL